MLAFSKLLLLFLGEPGGAASLSDEDSDLLKLHRRTGIAASLLGYSSGRGRCTCLCAVPHAGDRRCARTFVGMVEAPLLVRPYLKTMSRGELFALMSCGMAGVAGTVMVIYGAILGPVVPDALGHILIASIISTPAALAAAAVMVPFRADARQRPGS